eukprot:UC1_evm1s133
MGDWTANPFGQAEEPAQPFSDPSVTSASAGAADVPDYNPFEAEPSANSLAAASTEDGAAAFNNATPAQLAAAFGGGGGGGAAAAEDGEDVPSWAQDKPAEPVAVAAAAAPAPTKKLSKAEIKRQKAAESKRQKEYEERERQARKREAGGGQREANFPNFPQCMRKGIIKPCFHLDIKAEIPLKGQRLVRHGFLLWEFTVFCYFWNFVGGLAGLATDDASAGTTCGLATAWFVVNSITSYLCWFHPMYSAFRKDSSLRFGWFFLCIFFQFCVSIFFAVGLPGTGAIGFMYSISASNSQPEAAIVMFVASGFWMLHALLSFYVMTRTLKYYRSTGGSFEKMQQEAGREAFTAAANNEQVRGAAVSAANDAVFGSNA